MTEAEVTAALRQPGRLEQTQSIDGHRIRTLSYGPPDSSVLVQFDGGAVVSKYSAAVPAE